MHFKVIGENRTISWTGKSGDQSGVYSLCYVRVKMPRYAGTVGMPVLGLRFLEFALGIADYWREGSSRAKFQGSGNVRTWCG